MSIFRKTDTPAEALAKIAHLTGVFERLVADAGARRAQIEQLLAEIASECDDAKILSGATVQRAA
jgi:hypothetical protein